LEKKEPVLSINNQLLGDLINGGYSNPVGSYGVLDLMKKHIKEGGEAVLYDKLTGRITHYITLDETAALNLLTIKS
jgi:hypothetical protein